MGGSGGSIRRGEVALLLASCALSLLLADQLLRALTPDAWYVYPPHYRHVLTPLPGILPGVEGVSVFSVNADGIRGDPLPDAGSYRILALGGSTTECGYLDDAEAWPYLVQQELNATLGSRSAWVGNVGRRGGKAAHHAIQVEKLLAQYGRIDAVALLVGLNDLLERLLFETERDYRSYVLSPSYRERLLQTGFSVFPGYDASEPWYRRTGFHRFWRTKRLRALRPERPNWVMDRFGRVYETWRRHRREATALLPQLPDLSSAVDIYLRGLDRIVAGARAAGARVVFLTQPVLWRPDLPAELRELLWMGGVGNFQSEPGHPYYSVEALARGMGRFNTVLRASSRARGVELVDLAARLPADSSVFFDDAHFNESGARKVARLLTEHLLARPPFSERG